ncbi:MAG: MFS transporter, partial [Nocardioidaceae bacterium]
MSTAPPDLPDVDQPRFRDALRSLPGRVWIVSLGILVNRVGNFLPVFIVLYLTGRGYSAGAAGFVLGVSGLGNVLGNAVGGYLADKIGRRWTIVVSAVPTAGLTAMVPFVEPFPVLVAVVGLIGVTSQIYRPAAAAVLLDSVATDQQRLAAFGVFRFAMNIGAALGGVIGGVLASTSY